jgi:minor extracellular serine protease Vpr
MASPHTAGIVALMLEACPTLSPEQIKLILSKTSTRDALTGTDSNNNYGYGRINAFQAVKAALSIQNANSQTPGKIAKLLLFPVPAQNKLVFSNTDLKNKSARLLFFDISGRRVCSNDLNFNSSGECEMSISHLSAGIYSFRMESDGNWIKGKIAVE